MAFLSLGGFLRGATAARVGYEQGQERRAAMERQQAEQNFDNTAKLLTLYATLNKPDAIAIHKAERQIDIENPTLGEQASMLRAKKYQPGSARAGANQDQLQAQRSLSAVRGQLADTQQQIGRDQQLLPNLDPAVDPDEVHRIQQALPGLEARADSLGAVRDSIAGVVQGRPVVRPAPTPPAPPAPASPALLGASNAAFEATAPPNPAAPGGPSLAAQQQAAEAFRTLNAKAAALLQQGVDPAKVRAALAQDVASLSAAYGLAAPGQP